MKHTISTNKLLTTDQMVDLDNYLASREANQLKWNIKHSNHLAEDLASRGTTQAPNQATAKAITSWLKKNVSRVIVWVNDKKVVDNF